MLLTRLSRPTVRAALRLRAARAVSTLSNNPHIYVFPSENGQTSILSLLPTNPPNPSLAIGTTTANPPTPSSFTGNPTFLRILDTVLANHATEDADVQTQAASYAISAGTGLIHPSPSNANNKRARSTHGQQPQRGSRSSGDGNTENIQEGGGTGPAGRGGWIHVSDLRNPPDFGRIAWPEDIFGSLEVDGNGQFVDERGNWQASGTYRVVTNEGILGLSDYLREKVVQRLKELEAEEDRK